MSTFKEWLEHWCVEKPWYVMSTATNGLESDDLLLAVSLVDLKTEKEIFTLRDVKGELLQKSQQYHKVTEELVAAFGLESSLFCKRVRDILTDSVVFTYNTPFQYTFLQQAMDTETLRLYDLTVISKAINSLYNFTEDDIVNLGAFYGTCKQVFNSIPINRVSAQLGFPKETPPGMCPCQKVSQVLLKLFSSVSSKEIQVLES